MMVFRFSPFVSEEERRFIREALSEGPREPQRILHDQSRVKAFYCVDTPVRPLFVKVRAFPTWSRRLGRTLRKTKEEEEYRNFLALRQWGVSCPEPVGVARQYRGFLILRSLLLMEYLPDALPLRLLLNQGGPALGKHLDELVAFLNELHEKGIIHEDLQWDNLLARPTLSGPRLYLVDALHVRRARKPHDKAFRQTLAWFVRFLISGGAPREVVHGFLERIEGLGLQGPAARKWLMEQAHRMEKRP